ncbi:hypothetical protein B0T18DRAFT_226627 [Schizothecium vesticola]|uniref:Uncharacterized protein n=1 Tax=Schizothecium vesticola TaxID=314040 RepID=A0AA40EKU4_9PEZI|nr:hypothetical protein B0T18DRAFT_226627 [Schizothecium vesticola]
MPTQRFRCSRLQPTKVLNKIFIHDRIIQADNDPYTLCEGTSIPLSNSQLNIPSQPVPPSHLQPPSHTWGSSPSPYPFHTSYPIHTAVPPLAAHDLHRRLCIHLGWQTNHLSCQLSCRQRLADA